MSSSLLLVLLGTLHIGASPEVTCPAPMEAEQALAEVLNGAPPNQAGAITRAQRDLVTNLRSDGGPDGAGAALIIDVRDTGGRLVAQRRLPPLQPGERCVDRARAVAVMVATAAGVGLLPDPHAGPAAGAPGFAPPLAAAPEPAATTRQASPPTAVAAAASPSRIPPEVGLVAGAGRAGATTTPTASVELSVPLRGRWRMRLSAFGAGGHEQTIGTGQVLWSRWGAALLAAWRVQFAAAWELELAAGPVAAVRLIAGRDLPKAEGGVTFDPGAEGTVRLVRRLSWGGVSLQIGESYWPRVQEVFLRESGVAVTLPAWELTAGIGIRFHWGLASG